MKPKVALVKDGFLPAGSENKRGRLSGEAIARLKELAAKGWSIEGYEVSKPTAQNEPVKVEKVSVDPNRIADIPSETRPEDSWEAYRYEDGKPVAIGMRTCCNVCKASLTYCPCSAPKVWVDHETESVVNFKPRTSPLPSKRW